MLNDPNGDETSNYGKDISADDKIKISKKTLSAIIIWSSATVVYSLIFVLTGIGVIPILDEFKDKQDFYFTVEYHPDVKQLLIVYEDVSGRTSNITYLYESSNGSDIFLHQYNGSSRNFAIIDDAALNHETPKYVIFEIKREGSNEILIKRVEITVKDLFPSKDNSTANEDIVP